MPTIYAAYRTDNLSNVTDDLSDVVNKYVSPSQEGLKQQLREIPESEWAIYKRELGTTKDVICDLITDADRVMKVDEPFEHVRVNAQGQVRKKSQRDRRDTSRVAPGKPSCRNQLAVGSED